ncbi:ELMO domain-containing protein 3 isoform X2 [Oopsacas minuta]|uniref:ELMO domain-containing protein 3 isoform X2 n=1 Tax=Oopsacas minuta TaxID=111878 RepID=A0AAV7JX57_9METZ|nr:ELMO domain-containing protein 3 isoform X2 [Oopsacas minuta]
MNGRSILSDTDRDEFSFDDVAPKPSTTLSPIDNNPKHDITSQPPAIYVLTGPNNSSKRSLALKLQAEFPATFERVMSHTTRQPRPLETPGVDYNYVTRQEFIQLIQDDKFLQYIYVGKSDVKMTPDINQLPEHGDLFGITKTRFHQASHSNTLALILTLHPAAVDHIRSLGLKTEYIYLSSDNEIPVDRNLLQYPGIKLISSTNTALAYSEVKKVILPDFKVKHTGIDVQKFESYLATQVEWENVGNIQAIRECNALENSNISQNSAKIVNSTHALEYFRNKRMLEYINRIRLPPQPTGIRKLIKIIFGPPALHESLINERNLVLAMALHTFDNSDNFHTAILDSIYRLLTRSKISCPRFGSHWEEIGFQGNDPATDLRGAGMLGLVNLFDFVTSPIAYQIALDILKLSRDVTQTFPMCALSMSLTVMVITFLRDGRLSKICNSRGMVFSVVNDVYKALFYKLYNIWKYQHKTIWDSSSVLTELELDAKRNIQKLLNEFYNALTRIKSGENRTVNARNEEVVFQGIDEIELELSLTTE